jgi:shikimate kinase
VVARRTAEAEHRPLARDPEAFAALYRQRLDSYRLAEVHIPIDCDDPGAAVNAILAHPLLK